MKTALHSGILRGAVLAGALMLAASTVQAQSHNAGVIAEKDSIRALQEEKTRTRPRHTTRSQEQILELLPMLRARGIRNPIFVVDGRVQSAPLPVHVSTHEIECIEFRPGRVATLEFRRGFRDGAADGVLIIWTRGSRGRKPPGCKIPLF